MAPGSDFKDLQKSLTADGIKSELRSDDLPGTPKLLAFEDNKGTAIEVFTEWDYFPPNQQVVGVGPMKLGHCAFIVKDVKATCDFYERVLGFKVSDWNGDFFVFMRCNPDHHTVNFLQGKKDMMHHIAFEVRDFSGVEHGCDVLSHHKIPIIWGPSAARAGAQRVDLSSQSGQARNRVFRRARSDSRRGARLFRSAAVAHRPPATAEGVDQGQPRGVGLGPAADAGLSSQSRSVECTIERQARWVPLPGEGVCSSSRRTPPTIPPVEVGYIRLRPLECAEVG